MFAVSITWATSNLANPPDPAIAIRIMIEIVADKILHFKKEGSALRLILIVHARNLLSIVFSRKAEDLLAAKRAN